jgi:hypothetical protein
MTEDSAVALLPPPHVQLSAQPPPLDRYEDRGAEGTSASSPANVDFIPRLPFDEGEDQEFVDVDFDCLWVTASQCTASRFHELQLQLAILDPWATVSRPIRTHADKRHGQGCSGDADPESNEGFGASAAATNTECRRSTAEGRRVFASSKRLRTFAVQPLVPCEVIHRVVASRWWPPVFVGACCILETAVLLPSFPGATPLYVCGMLMSAMLFAVNLSQYSRATVLHCLTNFNFWYQLTNQAVLVTADTYVTVLRYGNYWTVAPHILQATAISLSVYAMDACYHLSFTVKSIVVCYYGFIVTAMLVDWRVKLRTEKPDPIDVGVTTFELSTVAEGTAVTCAVFMLRFGFNYIVRKLPAVLINFPLVEVQSAAEKQRLSDWCEFAVTLSPTPDAVREASRDKATALIHGILPSADVFYMERDRARNVSRTVVYCPSLCALSVDATPLFPIARIEEWTHSALATWVRFAAIAVLLLDVVPLPEHESSWATLACLIVLQSLGFIVFALHMSQYSRGVMARVLRTFELWFLTAQVAVLCACNGYRSYHNLGWAHLPSCVLAWVTFFASALFQDAGHFSRNLKALTHVLAAVVMAWTIASWRVYDTSVSDRTIGIYDFQSTVGTLAQSCALTLLTYCLRYAYNAKMFGADTVITFNATEIASRYAEDRTVVDSSMAYSITEWARTLTSTNATSARFREARRGAERR